jgi:hypothetical protein
VGKGRLERFLKIMIFDEEEEIESDEEIEPEEEGEVEEEEW